MIRDNISTVLCLINFQCELMVETYEDDLTQWYWHHQKENLTNWLCIERVLDPGEEGKDFFVCFQLVQVKLGEKGGARSTELEFGINPLHVQGGCWSCEIVKVNLGCWRESMLSCSK